VSGSFLFDDFPNLKPMGANGGVVDWNTFKAFVLNGFSGPTGRPLSLVTFLLNDYTWPAQPADFKKTNIFIHLLNANLVFLVTRKILITSSCTRFRQSDINAIALVSSAIWLLHPYLVSTTLYVVQRMAMLATMFCLAAMLAYLHGRALLSNGRAVGYVWMSSSVAIGTLLATFSKENGAILPLLLLCLEATLLGSAVTTNFRWWRWVFLVVPSIAVVLYLLRTPFAVGWFDNYAVRDFSPYERVLTQSRVIISYLGDLFIPKTYGGMIYYDDLVVSKGLLNPISTLVSIVLIAIVSVVAIVKRRKWPVTAFGLLYFLGSLLIESSTMGLEMKFDHRVYMGSTFLFLPFVVAGKRYLSAVYQRVVAVIVIAALGTLTLLATSLWGDHEKLSLVWAQKSPFSARTQIEAAQNIYNGGDVLGALRFLDRAALGLPDNFQLHLTQLLIACQLGKTSQETLASVLNLAKTGQYRHTDFYLLNSFFETTSRSICPDVNVDYYIQVVKDLMDSSPNKSPSTQAYAQLHYYYGLGLLKKGKVYEAKQMLDLALKSRSSLHMRMNIAAYKASAGLREDALVEALFVLREIDSGDLKGRGLIEAPARHDVEHFIAVLQAELEIEDANRDK
jgi:hypothetical protein